MLKSVAYSQFYRFVLQADQTLCSARDEKEVASGEVVANVHGKPEGKFTFTSHEPGKWTGCLDHWWDRDIDLVTAR